jgi:predicted amidohydrolase
MRVGVVQMNSQDDVAENLRRATALVSEAAKAGAEVISLPENFAFFGEDAQKRAHAEVVGGDANGPIVAALAEVARRHGVHVVAGGMPERSDDAERPFNTSVLVDPKGSVVATYRKVHLFDVDLPDGTSLKESRATMAGVDVAVSDVRGAKLGMAICYDLRFPELFRALGAQGARVVTVPAAFTLTTGKDHWHVLLRARAIENQLFVVAAAQHGKHPRGRQTYGKSVIVDPWGDVLAQCGEGEGTAVATLDFAYQDRVREALPCLLHRKM